MSTDFIINLEYLSHKILRFVVVITGADLGGLKPLELICIILLKGRS